MAGIEAETDQHLLVLEELSDLFREKVDDDLDPDIFMEMCLRFALAYHQEFLDKESFEKLIEESIQKITPTEFEEFNA